MRFLFLGIILFSYVFVLKSQPASCNNWEELPPNTQFGPAFGQGIGSTFYIEDQVTFSILGLPNAPNTFGSLTVLPTAPQGPWQGQYARLIEGGISMDYTTVPGTIQNVGFAITPNGTYTLKVNGENRFTITDPANFPTNPAPGINMTITPINFGAPLKYIVLLTGVVDMIELTAQNILIDNICFLTDGLLPCTLSNLNVTPTVCNNEDQFYFDINFFGAQVGNNGFYVSVNQTDFGPFDYGALPVRVGPFQGNSSTTYNILVGDVVQSDCKIDINLDPINCSPPLPCSLSNLIIEKYDCEGDSFLVDIDFQFEASMNGMPFTIQGNGTQYGTFVYGDQNFYTLGPFYGDGSQTYEIVIQDVTQNNCLLIGTFLANDCLDTPCDIQNLHVDTGDCNADGTYALTVNFLVQNPGNSLFEVWTRTEYLGFFPIASLPHTFVSFAPSLNAQDLIRVCINDQPNCCSVIEFERPDCMVNTKEYQGFLTPLATPNPNSGILYLMTDFQHFETIKIINIQGNAVFESKNTLTFVNLIGQPNGIYWIKIVQHGRTYFQKVVLNR